MEQFSQMIATALKLPVHRVENTLKLLQGGATIPFISRYRKEATGRPRRSTDRRYPYALRKAL